MEQSSEDGITKLWNMTTELQAKEEFVTEERRRSDAYKQQLLQEMK